MQPDQAPGALEVVTFGCRLNALESEVIRAAAAKAGLCDAIVFNTCAVTAEAERQARQAIRRARRRRPDATILVTGCAAELSPTVYTAMPEVDRVLGNGQKLRREAYDLAAPPPTALPLLPEAHAAGGVARAHLQIQQGCDHHCTFCTIRLARGESRSVPPNAVIRESRRLVETGYREIVLTGVDLTAYGLDLDGTIRLGTLVRRLLAELPGLTRLRLSSLDPAEIDEALWRALAEEERLMPHLHLSLQSGDDLVLKRMRRRHDRAGAVAAAERARRLRPGIALGADMIAGFPTESEAGARTSIDHIGECGIAYLHVFPYSARPGTAAARMPALPGDIVRERAARLRAAGRRSLAVDLAGRVGSVTDALVEQPGLARTDGYAPIRFAGTERQGAVVRLKVVASDGAVLAGEQAASTGAAS